MKSKGIFFRTIAENCLSRHCKDLQKYLLRKVKYQVHGFGRTSPVKPGCCCMPCVPKLTWKTLFPVYGLILKYTLHKYSKIQFLCSTSTFLVCLDHWERGCEAAWGQHETRKHPFLPSQYLWDPGVCGAPPVTAPQHCPYGTRTSSCVPRHILQSSFLLSG